MKNTKGLIFQRSFKISHFFTKNTFLRIIGIPIRLTYKILFQWVLGIDIPDTTLIGKNLQVYHGQGLIVHANTIIGSNVTLRHNTTIGVSVDNGGCPVIGDNVNIGANSVIIGDICIGDNVIVGAGSVVIKDIESNCIIAGNPARLIRKIHEIK